MKTYWKDINAKQEGKPENSPEKNAEIPGRDKASLASMFDNLNTDGPASRRDFLKLWGFSFAVTAMASCQSKVRKVVPYVIAPHEITPGEANYYASTFMEGSDCCSIIVKTREGRPIKIEGNPESTITGGGTSARVQASVLELYDTGRYQSPQKEGNSMDWESLDMEIADRLQKISSEEGTIVLLTPSIYSPSTEAAIAEFIQAYPGTEWVMYDAISASGIMEANGKSFGKKIVPDYRFDKADVILSIGADFLGSWLSPTEYTRQYSSRRNPDKEMNQLIQIESNLSLTGSNADQRIMIKPSQESAVLLNVHKEIVSAVEGRAISAPGSPVDTGPISKKLLKAKGKSLVVSGSNDRDVQVLVNEINRLLGNIGETIIFDSYLRTHRGRDSEMTSLVERMNRGEIDALLTWDVNPAYTWYDSGAFVEGIGKVDLTVSLSRSPDETSDLSQYNCPDHHYLESWNDAEPKKNSFSLVQPVIQPLFSTRQFQESLLTWSGNPVNYYEFMTGLWSTQMMPLQMEHMIPEAFVNHTLQKGVFVPSLTPSEPAEEKTEQAEAESPAFDPTTLSFGKSSGDGTSELVLYASVGMGPGRQANNPWLQELPDPVTRVCWDNYATFSPRQAKELSLNSGDVVTMNGIEVPVLIQPGQAYETIGIAIGYGRKICGTVGNGIGTDVWPLSSVKNENIQFTNIVEEISPAGRQHQLAQTQTHHSMEGREFVRESDSDSYKENPAAGNEAHEYFEEHAESLYDEREFPNHHWGMAIDLSTCTGCANCVIACQAENNIPVVGKEEVTRVHEMHWMRIDRYYSDDEENPGVVFQPVMCQHCDNAPCENVCPVAATNQNSEGLNQMVYNRCIGTRYCNNNCPYKVRRFNWFNYTEAGTLKGNLSDAAGMTLDMRRMVLNPDVTVRSQGVIEKCSLCVQRIQEGKLKAKAENRAIPDGEIQTACSQTCPANSIVFGDMNDPASAISRLIKSGRRYNLLEEIYTKPSVQYLTKIRNT